MWVKRKFVLWQHRYNNLLTEKKSKKVYVSEAINFWKYAVIVNLNKFSSDTIFRLYTRGKFTWSNSVILVEALIRWKRGYDIFLIDYYAGNFGNKNIGVT